MEHIEHSTKIGYTVLLLSDNEAKVLSPIVRRALTREQHLADHIKDILDDERRQVCLMRHKEKESALQDIYNKLLLCRIKRITKC